MIVLTGEPTPETAKRALEFGVCQYLQKPIRRAQLLEAVAKATSAK